MCNGQHRIQAPPAIMTAPIAYLNGRFVPFAELTLPVWDAGFVFGATVTDLVRTFRGKPFRLDDHIARFRQSCKLCRIPLADSDEELRITALKLVEHNVALLPATTEHAIVMFSTPGSIGYYGGQPGGAGDGPQTFGMHTFPLPLARYRKLFKEGATLVVPPTRHLPAACVDPRAKMRSRMHWWIAEQEVKAIDPAASALLLDTSGYVTETAVANLLVVLRGTVVSPPRDSILGGISLRVVEELCGELKVPFAERPLTLSDCQSADEAMLAGTAFCVAGVRRLHGVDLPWPGTIVRRLLAAWSARVGVDIEGQITGRTV
jgi:branched-subunit amino acid aminotransferase/4-amino-4-deoxychorismate lyase